ncbi:DUF4232 domain-containing protein [Kitasatospora sp. NPDC054939]
MSVRTSVRTSRTSRARLVAVAASATLAALSLTACSGNGDVKTAAAPSTAAPTTTTPPATAPAPQAPAPAGGSGAAGSTAKAPAGGPQSTSPKPAAGTTSPKTPAAPAPAAPTTCQGSNTKTIAAPLNRPVNHLLLTVTNTGPGICFLYGYPAVRFGEAQSVPPVIAESRPQAVVSLKPGESGYASVNLSSTDGSNGSNGHTATSLAVYFHGPSGNESVGAAANPSLPAKGVYVDDSLKVTYWQQSMDLAVSW